MRKILPLLALPTMASSQTEVVFLLQTLDSRNAAMGRSSIATTNGRNAVFANPALLGSLNEAQLQVGGRMLYGFGMPDVGDEEVDVHYALHPNHVSVSTPYPFSNPDFPFGFALGYQTYHDFGFKLVSEEDGEEFIDDVSGGLNTISPAAPVDYKDRFFTGLSYNRSIFSGIEEEIEFSGEDEITAEVETKGSFFVIGGLARLTPALAVGLAYRPAFEWTWEVEDGSIRDLVPGVFGQDIDLEVPPLFGIGVSYETTSGTVLAAEYQTRPYSDYEIDGSKIFRSQGQVIDDAYAIRLGVEVPGEVPLCVGLFRDAVIAVDFEAVRVAPKRIIAKGFGAGASQLSSVGQWLNKVALVGDIPTRVVLVGHSLGGDAVRRANFEAIDTRITIDPINPDVLPVLNQRSFTFSPILTRGRFVNILASTMEDIDGEPGHGLLGHRITGSNESIESNTNHFTIVNQVLINGLVANEVQNLLTSGFKQASPEALRLSLPVSRGNQYLNYGFGWRPADSDW